MLVSDPGTDIWNQTIQADVNFRNRSGICHTFLRWDFSAEGALRHFIYNKFVSTEKFPSYTHYCAIKDDNNVVQSKVDEVSIISSCYSFTDIALRSLNSFGTTFPCLWFQLIVS